VTVRLAGCVVMPGATFTVKVAVALVTLPLRWTRRRRTSRHRPIPPSGSGVAARWPAITTPLRRH
jgi:hypothetical protein